jgi:RNA polymerase sigma factor (sigma-70 family)
MTLSDNELLRDYARGKSQDAFAEVVRRHVNLVYSTALRQVGGDAHLAQDVAQTVFTDLARKAGPLSRRAALSGWLYTSARFAAANVARTEHRRRDREDKYMSEPTSGPEPAAETGWENIRPTLDDAMHDLKETEREAILLRYFENRQFADVGAKLGLSENAARMRVERALEKLRGALARRGVATSAGLASVISANAVQVAPSGLAASLASAATATAATATLTLFKLMIATKMKIGIGALVVAATATALVVQHQTQEKLRADNNSLRQQIEQLSTDNESLSNRPPKADSNAQPDDQLKELLRLRGEVGLLRRQTNELGSLLADSRQAQARIVGARPEHRGPPPPLPDGYPKTPEAATKSIFESWSRGDWDGFFTNYGEPGVPREVYDRIFNDPSKSNYLAGMEVVSLGEPTNSFGSNMWFVPYKVRFADGNEKEFRLHVAQDPWSQRWIFKGGF